MGVLGLSVGGVWACVWARVNELACDKSSGFRQALARLRRGGEAVAPSPSSGRGWRVCLCGQEAPGGARTGVSLAAAGERESESERLLIITCLQTSASLDEFIVSMGGRWLWRPFRR